MANIDIKLSSVFNNSIHSPRTKSGYTLYTRIEGSNEEYSDYIRKAEKDSEYISLSNKIFNSPTNIRKIFLTGKRVVVHYYTPYIKGSNKSDYVLSKPVKKFIGVSNLFEVANNIANYEIDLTNYENRIAFDKNIKKPANYRVSGKFNFAAYPYALNNLEEIYFDWTLLMSPDILSFFTSVLNINSPQQLARNMITFKGRAYTENDVLIRLFEEQSNGGSRKIAEKFPRLKEISLISNLESLELNQLMFKYDKLDASNKDVSTWADKNIDKFRNLDSSLIIRSKINNRIKINKEFIVKTSTYKFDNEILNIKIKSYINDLERLIKDRREQELEEERKSEELKEQTEVEKLLLNIESELSGKSDIVLIHAYNCSGLTKEDWKNEIMNFTKANRDRYLKVLNLK